MNSITWEFISTELHIAWTIRCEAFQCSMWWTETNRSPIVSKMKNQTTLFFSLQFFSLNYTISCSRFSRSFNYSFLCNFCTVKWNHTQTHIHVHAFVYLLLACGPAKTEKNNNSRVSRCSLKDFGIVLKLNAHHTHSLNKSPFVLCSSFMSWFVCVCAIVFWCNFHFGHCFVFVFGQHMCN